MSDKGKEGQGGLAIQELRLTIKKEPEVAGSFLLLRGRVSSLMGNSIKRETASGLGVDPAQLGILPGADDSLKLQRARLEIDIRERREDPKFAEAYDALESDYNAVLRSILEEVPAGERDAKVWYQAEKGLLKELGY